MYCVLTAKRTKLLNLKTFRMLTLVLGAVVINTIALSALKMNCLAHIPYPFTCVALLRQPYNGVLDDEVNLSPRAVLNR